MFVEIFTNLKKLIQMRKTTLLFAILFSVNIFAQLSGTYSIGGGGDYATITEATEDLYTQGVSAPVVFQLTPDTYYEQVKFDGAIDGASETNYIEFRSIDSPSEWLYAPTVTDKYIVQLDSASFLRFVNINFSAQGVLISPQLFVINSESNGIYIDSCTFINPETGGYGIFRQEPDTGHYNNDVYITNNSFHNGNFGIYYQNHYLNDSKHLEILNNTFNNHKDQAIALSHVEDNYTENEEAVCIVNYNKIYASQKGMQLSNLNNNIQINNNDIECFEYGILVSGEGSDSNPVSILNNTIRLHISNSTTSSIISGLIIGNLKKANIFHNSIYLSGTVEEPSSALITGLNIGTFGNTLNIANNNISNYIKADGQSFSIISDSDNYVNNIDIFDNNNFYNNSSVFAKWLGEEYNTPEEWTAETGYNANGLNIPSGFAKGSDSLLYTTSNLQAFSYDLSSFSALEDLHTDINADTRNIATPNIGSIETKIILDINKNDFYICEDDLYQDTLLVTQHDLPEIDNDTIYWEENGVLASYNDTLIINPTTTTQYVCYIPFQDTIISDTINVEITSCVHVSEVEKSKIILYPNPTTDFVIIQLNAETIKEFSKQEIEIYDLSGKLWKSIPINQASKVNVSALKNGVYFIRIGSKVSKLIKQ